MQDEAKQTERDYELEDWGHEDCSVCEEAREMVRAERDRYREVLEEIADAGESMLSPPFAQRLALIARDALNRGA